MTSARTVILKKFAPHFRDMGPCQHRERSNLNSFARSGAALGIQPAPRPAKQFLRSQMSNQGRAFCVLEATSRSGMFEVEDVSPPPQSLGLHDLPPVSRIKHCLASGSTQFDTFLYSTCFQKLYV